MSQDAQVALKKVLEADPPYGAKVTFETNKAGPGWSAPPLAPWLETAAKAASNEFYGKEPVYYGMLYIYKLIGFWL